MANRHDAGEKTEKPQKQDQDTGTKNAREFIKELRAKYQIDEHLILSLRADFKLPKGQSTPRKKKLSEGHLYKTGFLGIRHFNMSVIDLNGGSTEDHKVVARYLEGTLLGPTERPTARVVHLFRHAKPERMTALNLSIVLRKYILNDLPDRRPKTVQKGWGLMKLHPAETRRKTEFEITMDIVEFLIKQALEELPKTMHFIFSGLRMFELNAEQRLNLASFMFSMAQRIATVIGPKKDKRMVKCVFCGDGLLGSSGFVDYFEKEKQKVQTKGGDPTEMKRLAGLCTNTMMLKWERGEWHRQATTL